MLFDSILDQVIDNTARGHGAPTIVAQQHDTNQVDWLRGMADPGEMLSCGYLPELRRRDHENEETHYARIKPIFDALPADIKAKLNAAGSIAANRRHKLAMKDGKVTYVGIGGASWHKLGTDVSAAMTIDEAFALAPQVDIVIDKIRNEYEWNGQRKKAGSYSLVRRDTGETFADVGERYTVIQPRHAFDYANDVLGRFGARIETLGHTFNGKSMFMTVQFPNLTFSVNGKDENFAYGIFTNQHGGRAAKFFPCTFRAYCANTQRQGEDRYGKLGVSIRHTGTLASKVADAQRAMKLGVEAIADYKDAAQAMARTKIEPVTYFNNILDEVCEVTSAQMAAGSGQILALMVKRSAEEREAAAKRFEKQCKERRSILDEMIQNLDRETNRANDMAGTVWAAMNAATEYADHYQPGRKVGTTAEQSARYFESTLNGERDEIKQVAYRQALAAL